MAVVSLAMQIAEGCKTLHYFWESIRDAPEEIAIIMEDLEYLQSVVQDIARDKSEISAPVLVGLKCCQAKLHV